ncbi:hypothetical protein BJX62DRAFT_244470 [Aspergillus germanicus]
MQISLPLALHLRSPVTYNIFTKEHWKPGEKFDQGRTLNDFSFLDHHSDRGKATILFAEILRAIFSHPDWSQLHDFFSTRYPESDGSDRSDSDDESENDASTHPEAATRTLQPFDDSDRDEKPSIVHFRTDLESVPRTSARSSQQPAPPRELECSDLNRSPPQSTPGSYHEVTSINGTLHGWQNGSFCTLITPIRDSTAGKGGRARYWAEWALLWTVIADWVYEHDVEALQLGLISSYSHKYQVSDEEGWAIDWFGKIPREAFYARFGNRADSAASIRYAELLRVVGAGNKLLYDDVSRQMCIYSLMRLGSATVRNAENIHRRFSLRNINLAGIQ